MRRFLIASGVVVLAAAAVVGVVVAPGIGNARGATAPSSSASATSAGGGSSQGGTASGSASGAASTSDGSEDTVRTAVVGDSLSAGRSKFLGNGLDDKSWMTYAQGHGVQYVGGWARAGALPQEMAAAVQPVRDVDVLVILAGTNTVGRSATEPGDEASFRQIVKVIDPERVVISAIPPFGPNQLAALTYNRQLEQFAIDQGWTFTDPWGWARTGANGRNWKSGISADSVHPATPAGYEHLGDVLHATIVSVGRRS